MQVPCLFNEQLEQKMRMNIKKIIYLNCGETYENMIDHHRSYTHNLSSCDITA